MSERKYLASANVELWNEEHGEHGKGAGNYASTYVEALNELKKVVSDLIDFQIKLHTEPEKYHLKPNILTSLSGRIEEWQNGKISEVKQL